MLSISSRETPNSVNERSNNEELSNSGKMLSRDNGSSLYSTGLAEEDSGYIYTTVGLITNLSYNLDII
jgi:hypothetical protein